MTTPRNATIGVSVNQHFTESRDRRRVAQPPDFQAASAKQPMTIFGLQNHMTPYIHIVLEANGRRTHSKIQISEPRQCVDGFVVEVAMPGLREDKTLSRAGSAGEALQAALGSVGVALAQGATSGTRVLLVDEQTILTPELLMSAFRPLLARFAEPGDVVGPIVSGPQPRQDGTVVFVVLVGIVELEISASPLGVACIGDYDIEASNLARKSVEVFLQTHRDEMAERFREAGRLRRAAGAPPLAGNTREPLGVLLGAPVRVRRGVLFQTQVEGKDIDVVVHDCGSIIDHSDNWDALSVTDRDAAMTTAIDYVLTHREEAASLGLDCGLLTDLWR